MKKILALVLCLCMLGSLAMPAFAAEEAATALLTVTELAPVATITEEEIPAEEETSDEEDAPVVEEVSAEEDTPAVEETPEEDGAEKDDSTLNDIINGPYDSGSFGTEGSWAYYDDYYGNGKLVFSGWGPIPDYEEGNTPAWAKYYDGVTTIEIKDTLSRIGDNAFANAPVTTLYLPSGLKAISASAFSGCTELENVYFDGSESELTALVGADYFGSSVTVHYGADDTTTDDTTTDDTTTDDTTGEEADLTWDYDEVSKTLVISGEGAIPDYEKPDNAPWHSHYDECAKIVIESGITAIGDYAFGNFAVTELSIPATAQSIGQGAFSNCTELTEVTIPEGVKTMEGESFSGCSGLTTVYLPNSLRSYGDSEFFAFVGCDAITDVYYNGTESQFTMYLGANYFPETAEIHYGDLVLPMGGSLTESVGWVLDEEYTLTIAGTGPMPDYEHSSKTPWADYRADIKAIVLEEGITHAGDCAFDYCSNNESLSLPSTLVSIGDHAFASGAAGQYADDFAAYIVPEGVVTIDDWAFWMNDIPTISLPETVESVGSNAFGGCQAETVYVPGGCALADDAFANNPIKVLGLGEGHTAIPQCFAWLTTLTHLELSPGFEVLSGDFIMQNEDLESVVVGIGYEPIELVGWMDEDGNVYFPNDILMTDVSGLTLTAVYQYIWRDPGPFEDVGESDWFYEYVKYCYQNGIMNGTSETTFEPDAGATRAEVVTVLYRMAGEPEVTGASSFGDVAAGQWYSDAVAWAASEGIAKGYDDGNFWPHSLVTREEFLVFLNRFAGSMGMNWNTWSDYYHLKTFADYANVSDWAQEAEVWSVIMGLQTGVETSSGTYLYPGESILRSELATFLCRFMDSLYSILEVEMLQSCIGMGTDYVIQLFGSASSVKNYGQATCPQCSEVSEFSYWYYDGFAFAVHKLTDGTEYICYWGYY